MFFAVMHCITRFLCNRIDSCHNIRMTASCMSVIALKSEVHVHVHVHVEVDVCYYSIFHLLCIQS